MPLSYATIQTNIYTWAAANVPAGMPVIWYEPNSPRPVVSLVKVPYITLLIASSIQINQDYSAPNANSSGVINMSGDRQFILQIQAYGGDTFTVLENLRTSLQKQSVLDTLRTNGIVFFNSFDINDITTLVDSQFEERAQMDIRFGIGQTYTDAPGYFDTIEIEEEVLNAVEVIVYNDTITITSP